MAFDDLAGSIASTLSGVFGGAFWFTRPDHYSFELQAVIRKDQEVLDDNEQVIARLTTARIAKNDIDFTPERGDTLDDSATCTTWTIGRRLADDNEWYVFEVTS